MYFVEEVRKEVKGEDEVVGFVDGDVRVFEGVDVVFEIGFVDDVEGVVV